MTTALISAALAAFAPAPVSQPKPRCEIATWQVTSTFVLPGERTCPWRGMRGKRHTLPWGAVGR